MSAKPSEGRFASRRGFLRSSTAAFGGLALAAPLSLLQAHQRDGERPDTGHGYGPLVPVANRTTGLPLLKLPRGFRYQSFGWTGDVMSDGTLTPDRHDGMAVVEVWRRGHERELVLMRNHERGASPAGSPLPIVGMGLAPVYDPFNLSGVLDGLGGGTTALFFSRGVRRQRSRGPSRTVRAARHRGVRG